MLGFSNLLLQRFRFNALTDLCFQANIVLTNGMKSDNDIGMIERRINLFNPEHSAPGTIHNLPLQTPATKHL